MCEYLVAVVTREELNTFETTKPPHELCGTVHVAASKKTMHHLPYATMAPKSVACLREQLF